MTATTELLRCEKCRRRVRVRPVWWFGKPYGTTCASRYGLTPEKRVRAARRPRTAAMEQVPLFEINDEEINDESEELT